MKQKFYMYTIELERVNGEEYYQLEVNTEELLDIVLRCAYKSLTIIKRRKIEVEGV